MSLNIVKSAAFNASDIAYQNYLLARSCIVNMMEESSSSIGSASAYWEEEMEGFDYMLEASPRLIAKLREHCYHITGIRSYEYRAHHSHATHNFAAKLDALRAIDKNNLFVPESENMGGFGHIIDGVKVNIDTLKFYESLIALDRAGFLQNVGKMRQSVLEIGSGWGGFAYQFKSLFPNSTYILVDLPPTMLFSMTYIMTQFPQAKIFVYGRDDVKELENNLLFYDFVFLPHFVFPTITLRQLDIAINMVSFQEMTSAQVRGYFEKIKALGCKMVYSHNRNRSRHNHELSSVADIFKECYQTQELTLLPTQYVTLGNPYKVNMKRRLYNLLKGYKQDELFLTVIW